MKTIEQLLELSKNPYYTFTNNERAVLDDFLEKKQARDSKNLQEKNSTNLEDNTPVRVRNIVQKTIPEAKDSGA
jgi:hypothetical protein